MRKDFSVYSKLEEVWTSDNSLVEIDCKQHYPLQACCKCTPNLFEKKYKRGGDYCQVSYYAYSYALRAHGDIYNAYYISPTSIREYNVTV